MRRSATLPPVRAARMAAQRAARRHSDVSSMTTRNLLRPGAGMECLSRPLARLWLNLWGRPPALTLILHHPAIEWRGAASGFRPAGWLRFGPNANAPPKRGAARSVRPASLERDGDRLGGSGIARKV